MTNVEKYHRQSIEYIKLANRHERVKELLAELLHADSNNRQGVKLTVYYRKLHGIGVNSDDEMKKPNS